MGMLGDLFIDFDGHSFLDNPWLWFTNLYFYNLKIGMNSSIMDIDSIEKLKGIEG